MNEASRNAYLDLLTGSLTRASALTEGGFSADDIKEIILQQAIYCGVPAGNHAFKLASEILAEVGARQTQ